MGVDLWSILKLSLIHNSLNELNLKKYPSTVRDFLCLEKSMAVELLHVVPAEKSNGFNVNERVAELVELLKNNDVENVVIIATTASGIASSWANSSDPFAIIGALEVLKLEFMNSNIEPRG